MNTLLLSSLLLVAAADEPPKPKVPVGKDTTYVTGPLDKNGYIDFEAALNERLGKGISPDKNANVLLWAAFGPTPAIKEMPPQYFKLLGMKEPPKNGDYFVDFSQFLQQTRKLSSDERIPFHYQQDWAAQRPWTPKDYPEIAEWLKANEKPLAVVIEAVKRPEYFNPLVTRRKDKEPAPLLGILLPSVNSCREVANALAARALLRVSEGKFDAAWEDLLACHRLGRHVARGATLLEALVGYVIHQNATQATLAYLERADLSSQQLLARLKELQTLPPLSRPAEKVELAERLFCLDMLQQAKRDGLESLKKEDCDPLATIDLGPALKACNKWYDRLAAAMRLPDRTSREKELDKIAKELKEAVQVAGDLDDLAKKLKDGEDVEKVISARIGDIFTGLLMPACRGVQHKFDRASQIERNLHAAFALAAYHKDNGKYPAKLADLAPKYIAAVPDDLCSGKPLVYKPTAQGYFFYSVGVNGEDDGGRGEDDEPRGDDLGVKMPLPELKKNK